MDNLTNHGLIDLMHHHWTRYKKVNSLQINMQALWERWVRV